LSWNKKDEEKYPGDKYSGIVDLIFLGGITLIKVLNNNRENKL